MQVSELNGDLNPPQIGIRLKADGGAMIYIATLKQLWTLTEKYYKQLDPGMGERYDDWKIMSQEQLKMYEPILKSAKEGGGIVEIFGRRVQVISPVALTRKAAEIGLDAPPDEVSPVTDAALEAAGKVAEALGHAIRVFGVLNPDKAEQALTELLWIAKNVGWETKSNRHLFRSKWTPQHDSGVDEASTPSRTESGGGGEAPSAPSDRV